MVLFGKKKPKDDLKKAEEKTSDVKAEKKEDKKEETGKARAQIERVLEDIIIEPWITEKSHAAMTENKYLFRVHGSADKKSAKRAVEAMYNVRVTEVNIVNIPPKKRNYGRYKGEKSGFKKAIVKLKEGDKIELFKGV